MLYYDIMSFNYVTIFITLHDSINSVTILILLHHDIISLMNSVASCCNLCCYIMVLFSLQCHGIISITLYYDVISIIISFTVYLTLQCNFCYNVLHYDIISITLS